MPLCKITVIKRSVFPDIAQEHCAAKVEPCDAFYDGQVFYAGYEKPEGFCDWAWNDIFRYVLVVLTGGDFSGGIFEGWMKDDRAMIGCCTDGVRPVVFRIEPA